VKSNAKTAATARFLRCIEVGECEVAWVGLG